MSPKLKTLTLLGILVILLVLTPRVQAVSSNNPILEQAIALIHQTLQPIVNRLSSLTTRVNNLEIQVNKLSEPRCATCSAVPREDLVKVINEEEAVNSLHSIFLGQQIFIQEDSDKDGVFDYASSLTLLFKSGNLIDSVLGTGRRMGYNFALLLKPQNFGWIVVATPSKKGLSGDRAFFVDETGVIRFESSGSATPSASSEPLNN